MMYGNKYLDDEIEFILVESNMSGDPNFEFELGKNTCYIWVYAGEGYIPHFHLITKNIKTCIMLKYPEYFLHAGYQDTIKSKYCTDLDNWLSEVNNEVTNWERLVDKWNHNNPIPTQQVPTGWEQPSYKTIYQRGTFSKE